MCDIVKNDRLTYLLFFPLQWQTIYTLLLWESTILLYYTLIPQTITLVKISSHWSKKKKSIFINQTVIVYVLNDST